MTELHNIENIVKKDIVLSAVQSENVLCSNFTFSPDCTAESGIDPEKRKQLKLLLKDIAKKIIKETYHEYRKNSPDLHQGVFPTTTD